MPVLAAFCENGWDLQPQACGGPQEWAFGEHYESKTVSFKLRQVIFFKFANFEPPIDERDRSLAIRIFEEGLNSNGDCVSGNVIYPKALVIRGFIGNDVRKAVTVDETRIPSGEDPSGPQEWAST